MLAQAFMVIRDSALSLEKSYCQQQLAKPNLSLCSQAFNPIRSDGQSPRRAFSSGAGGAFGLPASVASA
jgi:hypothetical protein